MPDLRWLGLSPRRNIHHQPRSRLLSACLEENQNEQPERNRFSEKASKDALGRIAAGRQAQVMDEIMEPTGTIEDSIRELLASDDEAARAYLKESFLSEAIIALFHARRDAGLTQAQLAARLGVKQPSIARLERDFSGSVTLRRYVEVAIACGVMPLDLALVPVEQLKRFVLDDPGAEKTASAFNAWLAAQQPVPLTAVEGPQTNVPETANVVLTVPEVTVPYTLTGSMVLQTYSAIQQPLWPASSTGTQTKVFAA